MNGFPALCRPVWAGCLTGLFAFLAPLLCNADAPKVLQKITTIEGITEYRLDNGLRLLLFPDPASSTVTVNLTIFVGSRHEGYGETGMAHLLEHMVFKGTPAHPNIPRALRDHGASFNGSTWVDRTNYYEVMPASLANLEFGIRLEADRLVNSLIRREDLVSEMTVVRNEFEMGENSPENILSQRMLAVAYEWHNYGKSTIGNRSDIERVPIERLQAFYRKHYRPDNAMLVLAGKFDEARALGYVKEYFGPLKVPARTIETTYTEEPPQDGERTVALRRIGSVGVVGVVYHIPAGAHADFAAIEVLEDILTSEPSGRLYQALVVSKKASRVRGTTFGWHDPGVLEILVQAGTKQPLEDIRDTLLATLERHKLEQITREEVERSRRKLLKERDLLMTQSSRIGIELSDWASQGDWRLFFLHRDRIARVTPADVARVASQYLQRSNRTVGFYHPTDRTQRVEIAQVSSIADLLKNFKGSEKVAAGEAFDPTPANIESHVQQAELPGGLRVALLPKKTRGEAVVAQLTLNYGNEQSLKGYPLAAEFLGQLMTRGTQKHSRQALQDELDKLKARLLASQKLGQVQFTIQCKRDTLSLVLQLLGQVLREPTLPQDELDVLKRQRKERLEKGKSEPFAVGFSTLKRKLSPYERDDVRYVPTVDEEIARIESLTAEGLRRLYREQVGGEAVEFVAVGDFDPAAIRTQIQSLLKDWKAPVPYQHIARSARTDVPGSREDIHTPDKANALYLAGYHLAMKDIDPDYPALQVADFILGSSPLSSRLANRIRQKEGLSYGVASEFGADARDDLARFVLFAICNPANMDKVDKAMAEELERFYEKGVEATELLDAKKAFLQQLKVQFASDAQLLGMLEENLSVNRTFAYYVDLEKKIANLTAEQVNAAIRKHLIQGRLVIVRAGDFHKKAETPK